MVVKHIGLQAEYPAQVHLQAYIGLGLFLGQDAVGRQAALGKSARNGGAVEHIAGPFAVELLVQVVLQAAVVAALAVGAPDFQMPDDVGRHPFFARKQPRRRYCRIQAVF